MLNTPRARRGMVDLAPSSCDAKRGCACCAKAAMPSRRRSRWRASLAVVYPHMTAIGGDGFWLVSQRWRERRRHRCLRRGGGDGDDRTVCKSTGHRGDSLARAARGQYGGGHDVGLGRGARSSAREYGGRLPLSRLVEDAVWSARARLSGDREPARAHRGEARRTERCAGICSDLPDRRRVRRAKAS